MLFADSKDEDLMRKVFVQRLMLGEGKQETWKTKITRLTALAVKMTFD